MLKNACDNPLSTKTALEFFTRPELKLPEVDGSLAKLLG